MNAAQKLELTSSLYSAACKCEYSTRRLSQGYAVSLKDINEALRQMDALLKVAIAAEAAGRVRFGSQPPPC